MMGHVWVDVTTFQNRAKLKTGIPRMMMGILREWHNAGYSNLVFCEQESEGFREVPATFVFENSEPGPGLASRRPSERLRFTERDLWVCLGPTWDVPGSSATCWELKQCWGFRTVFVICDVIVFQRPPFVLADFAPRARHWITESLRTADLVITISQHSRKDLMEVCAKKGVACPPIEVIRLGEDFHAEGPGPDIISMPNLQPEEPFVLCVGTLEIRKNHLLLYQVWRRLVEMHGSQTPKLLFVGGPGWLAEPVLHLMRTDPLTRDRIVLLQDVSDSQLLWLYRHCLFTLYPSFYEGWGLPVAESLALGKYCIASNSSSLPEIGGALVDVHDPYDGKACLECVERALFQPGFLAQREKEIQRHYQRTSWSACAGQLREHIESHFHQVFSRIQPGAAA